MNLTKIALKRPVSMALVILALVVFGITSIPGFRLELQPEMDMPMLMAMTVYPGADPESVEELVTKEVEAAGAEQSGVSTVTSRSAENMSMVMFQYEYGTDLDEAYMDLKTALDSARGSMPDDVQEPVVMELAMDQSAAMNLSVTAEGDSDIASYVDEVLVRCSRCGCVRRQGELYQGRTEFGCYEAVRRYDGWGCPDHSGDGLYPAGRKLQPWHTGYSG